MNKTELSVRVAEYMARLDFPEDACADILGALDKIAANGVEFSRFCNLICDYEQTKSDWHFTPVLEALEEICKSCDVHEYTGAMLLYLCMADGLRSHYRARGLDEQIFWETLADLRYKLEECRLVKGVNGTFVARWHSGMFKLGLFALGRLQFEIAYFSKSYTCARGVLPEGTKALNVHIPRTGTRLLHDEVLASYNKAKEFFAAEFVGGPTVFTCASWLLYPWNMTVLSAGSNLRAFCEDYEIVSSSENTEYKNLWRLFDCEYTGDPDALPQDTSLRRAYAARVKRGEPLGSARGIFFME